MPPNYPPNPNPDQPVQGNAQPQTPLYSSPAPQVLPETVTSPTAPDDIVSMEAKAKKSSMVSLVCFSLLLLGFFIPPIGILGLPLFLIGTIAGLRTLKATHTSNKKASIAIKLFKIIAMICITLATLFVLGIAFLIYAFSQGGGF